MKKNLVSWLATAVTMTFLDLLWLGPIAHDLYARALGPLLNPSPNLVAAAAFYLFYVTSVWWGAVCCSQSPLQAWQRGAALGAFAYGVYDLTNWAVIAGWPGSLVPIDWLWGTVLTGTCAWAGLVVRQRVS
jgi:uncharacterized membrane protein